VTVPTAEGPSDLSGAIEHIARRVTLIRLTDESAEFLARNGAWVEFQRLPTGYRVRVTRAGRMRESSANDAVGAIEVSRILASGAGEKVESGRSFAGKL
jgi:hypothetical protein